MEVTHEPPKLYRCTDCTDGLYRQNRLTNQGCTGVPVFCVGLRVCVRVRKGPC